MATYDERLMQCRSWKLETITLSRNGSSHRNWLRESLRSAFFARLFKAGLRSDAVASRAYFRGLSKAVDVAGAQKADWFIAHTQAALPVAAAAAERWNAGLGFDCEDLLSELGADPPDIVRLIEKKYLLRCDYISVPSVSVGERLVEQYGIKSPIVLYNVFPLKLADRLLPPKMRPDSSSLRLHWFGQTIGEGRGLEEAAAAVALLGTGVELHIRGRLAPNFQSRLESIVGNQGRLVFHPLVAHEDLIGTLGQFDVGLALEDPRNQGYARTVTNKLFAYLVSGLAIAATDTPGQKEVLAQIPEASFVYPWGRLDLLAEGLKRWLVSRDALREAQQASWDSARNRFCWDIEKQKLLTALSRN